MKKQKAFTLSEVLITLVIIGIIAAVTVPTLMANYRKQEVSSRLKKFYSNLTQAVRMAQIENNNFIYEGLHSGITLENFWENYLNKYMPITKVNESYTYSSPSDGGTISSIYTLNDGSAIIGLSKTGWQSLLVQYDINGGKAPNYKGKDIFYFHITSHGDGGGKWTKVCAGSNCNKKDEGGWDEADLKGNRAQLINNCKDGNIGSGCSYLIEIDGWEIKDDYPLL